MNDRIAIALYAGIGMGVISSLHVWYVHNTDRDSRFTFPFTEFGAGLPPRYAYLGSIITGIVTLWVIWILVKITKPNEVANLDELQPVLLPAIVLILILVGLGQFATGASYSKLALHGLALGVTGIAFLVTVRPFTLPQIISTYVSLLAFLLLLGSLWIRYLDEFELPHFPGATYFVLSALYIYVGSLLLIGYIYIID